MPLPYAEGPEHCLHLMSLISMLDHDLALVYSRYRPVFFRKQLECMNIQLIEVPDEEYKSLGANVLTMAPRKCIALEGNPRTAEKLRAAGIELLHTPGKKFH